MRHTLDCPAHGFPRKVALALTVIAFLAPAARAADYYWDGGAGTNIWDTVILNPGVTTNWGATENLPISTDNIILTAASAAGPITIDVNGARQVQHIEHSGASGDYTFGDTVGADTITIFQSGPASVLVNMTQGSDLIFNSNILLNQGGSVLRFNSTNAADNSGHVVVNGDVLPSASATGEISLSLTTTNKSVGPWVTVNGNISDGVGATIRLIAGVEETQSSTVLADHSGVVSVTGLNTFTGSVQVTGGILLFNSIQNAGSTIPNALGTPDVADSDIIMGVDNRVSTLRYVGTNPAGHSSNRVIHINGSNSQARIESSGVGPLVLSGTTTTDSFATNRSLRLAGSNSNDNVYGGVIAPANGSGEQQLLKSGDGKWILTAANTYEGLTSVEEGELVLQGAGARIGTQGGDVGTFSISSGATFTLDGGSVEALDLNNSGTLNFRSGSFTLTTNDTTTGGGSFTIGTNGAGTLRLEGGSQNFGNVTLGGTDDSLIADSGGTYAFSNLDNSAGGLISASAVNLQINGGVFTHRVNTGTSLLAARIQGTGGFTKQGNGTLHFNGATHTYTGDTRVEGGTLQVTSSDLPTTPTFVAAGATLDLTSAAGGDEVGRLSGAGTVISPSSSTFAVNFSGADGEFAGSITGTGGFNKRGTGKQILTGANSYTGVTTLELNGGTLEVAAGGSIDGTSAINYNVSTLAVTGGTIDTPGNIRGASSSVNAVLSISSGFVRANAIDRTINSQYLNTFTWTGGTVELLSATAINGSTTTAVNRPFGVSLTLDDDMALIVDDDFSVTGSGVLNINGGSVTADNIVTGGTINFTSGTMQMRNDQTLDAARLAALDVEAPLGAGRTLAVDGVATVNAPLTLAGGSFSAGQIVNPQNLILGSGSLNVTNSNLAIAAAAAVDVASGMTVNVTNGGLDNAGDLSVIGGALNFATASTNQATGEINAINATLTFTGGLANNGDVNLINSTVNGSLINGAGGSALLLGSNSFADDLGLSGSSVLYLGIGGDQAGEFDVVTVGGSATLNGALSVSLDGGFTPITGQSFQILSADVLTGTFAGLADGDLVGVFGGTELLIDYNNTPGNRGVYLVAGRGGDFNANGVVDAADYTVWRDGLGAKYSRAHYDMWKTYFGEPIDGNSGAGGVVGVPEPATCSLVATALAAIAFRCRRRPHCAGWHAFTRSG